jgi:methionyl-tRNA synthetase
MVLAPDIFARYQRLRDREVLMVSGSDTHGMPITMRAEQAHFSI